MFSNASTPIQKEDLIKLRFRRAEVLSSTEARSKRYIDLQKAMILGNAYHFKVKICFEAESGVNEVETTVWYATEQYAVLKGGVTIPVQCIKEIRF